MHMQVYVLRLCVLRLNKRKKMCWTTRKNEWMKLIIIARRPHENRHGQDRAKVTTFICCYMLTTYTLRLRPFM